MTLSLIDLMRKLCKLSIIFAVLLFPAVAHTSELRKYKYGRGIFHYEPIFENYGGFIIHSKKNVLYIGGHSYNVKFCSPAVTICFCTEVYAFSFPIAGVKDIPNHWVSCKRRFFLVSKYTRTVGQRKIVFYVIDSYPTDNSKFKHGAVVKRFVYSYDLGLIYTSTVVNPKTTFEFSRKDAPTLTDIYVADGNAFGKISEYENYASERH